VDKDIVMAPCLRVHATICLLLIALVCLGGCIRRSITITSQPAGALVWLNDEEIGRTPVTVPFTYYGVYDVRLEHEGGWMPEEQAAATLGVSIDEIRKRVETEKLDGRTENGQAMVRIYYTPLWTKKKAEAPFWEAPGPDLIAEAIPNNEVHLEWDFSLEPVGDIASEPLVERARQMRALMKQETRGK
jgi:hypothetical protein